MDKTYLFYDIETTGLNPCFDQILQFAAIRTDLNLNELNRYEFQIKLNCDLIPSPYAMLTHGIGIDESLKGIDEYSAIQQIFKLFNTPSTISLGYNTLGFDDEFLRFSFYRNLLPPYTHQYANNCSRMDLYPITVMFYLFQQDALPNWPTYNQVPSLKLERLSEANRLTEGPAHNAMVDVCATLELARKFIQKKPMWDYLAGYFIRDIDQSRTAQLTTAFQIEQIAFKEALLIDGKIGSKCNYIAPVLGLGQHNYYKNQNLWLRLDSVNFAEPLVFRRKAAENQLLLPAKSRYLGKLAPERQQLVNRNKNWLLENPERLMAIMNYHREFTYPKVPQVDADAALYDTGFPNPAEQALMQRFHQAAPAEKIQVAEKFSNPIYQQLAFRIIGRHFSSSLNSEQKILFEKYQDELFSKPSIDYRGQVKLTIPKALEEAANLKNTDLPPNHINLLNQYREFFLSKLTSLV
ncbi:MAG: exodeoxyribonuclease I [Proteobacteria bacterium]|nr:exodeoxyribonuclease I [Pseudomonadota bacterium]